MQEIKDFYNKWYKGISNVIKKIQTLSNIYNQDFD